MSNSFTARPKVKTTSRPTVRGTDTLGQSSRDRGRGLSGLGSTRTRGSIQSSTSTPTTTTSTSSTSSKKSPTSVNTTQMQHNRSINSKRPGFGPLSMNPRPVEPGNPEKKSDEASENQESSFCSGYTKIEANAKKRQQASEIARKEAEDYQRYKQRNALKYCNYVGTTGGGEMTEDTVRRRQANDVKNQKFNRLQNQQRLREEKKATEQREFDLKRAEARRKADENAKRDETVNSQDIRNKREAFLRQVEAESRQANNGSNRPTNATSSSSHSTRASTQNHSNNTRLSHSGNECTTTNTDEYDNVPDDVLELVDMFPTMDLNYLSGLYNEMGSLAAVVDVIRN